MPTLHPLRRLSCVLLAIAALTACSPEEEDTTVLDASSEALDTFATDVAEALCATNARCNLGLFPAEQTRCLAAQAVLYPFLPEHLVDDGTLALDPAQARACLDAIDNLVCAEADRLFFDDLGIMQRTCPAAIVGTVAEGADCYAGLECAPGLYCDTGDYDGPQSCPGTCQRLHGRPCPGDPDAGQPEPTVFCDPQTERCDPVAVECKPLSDVGGVCPYGDHECRDGLICEQGTCQLAREAGEACGEGDAQYVQCAQHLHCMADGTCQFAVWGLDAGEACDRVLRNCGNGLFCSDDPVTGEGTCQPVAQLGEACGLIPGGWRPCDGDLYCDTQGDSQSGTCATPLAPGSACDQHVYNECAGGRCDNGTCVAGLTCTRP